MIQATETLLRESGLAGAGIKQLVARSGAPVGSVYHFFPGGKTQIVTETLRLHSGKALQLFQRAFRDTSVPLPERLGALFRMAAKGFEAAGADKGCAIGCVTLDLRASDDSLRQVCDASFNEWVDGIASHMPWPDDETRRSFARMVVTSRRRASAKRGAGSRSIARPATCMAIDRATPAPRTKTARQRRTGLTPPPQLHGCSAPSNFRS